MRHVTETIKYIGCDDADIRLFESQYNVPEGMCYNSFVILDEKVAIMDTSDKRTLEQWKKNLTEALGDRKPDYLIVHHLEPDHASGIGDVLAMYPDIQVVCSAKAKTMIPLYFPDSDLADRVIAVKEGNTLELGEHTLTFVMAPMVHWPEVMVTYDAKDKVLFSADG
ncbi:FprA family A-type flavoprotein, partial [Prevotella sp.]|uniref:FprA family A-type flavoprotein n=1 Tax=Prevotella sp. TaxID=59823 RepID=UPI00307D0AA9